MSDLRLQNIMEIMKELLPILLNEDEPEGGEEIPGEEGIAVEISAGEPSDVLGDIMEEAGSPEGDDLDEEIAIDSADVGLEDEDDAALYRNLLKGK